MSGVPLRLPGYHTPLHIKEGETSPTGERELGQVWKTFFQGLSALHSPNLQPRVITVGASPFVYQNKNSYPVLIIVGNGTTTGIDWSPDGITFYFINMRALLLTPGFFIRVGYTVTPDMFEVPFI